MSAVYTSRLRKRAICVLSVNHPVDGTDNDVIIYVDVRPGLVEHSANKRCQPGGIREMKGFKDFQGLIFVFK